MNLINKLSSVKPWHYVWISILASELITLGLSAVQGQLWWGGVTRETIIIGAVDALVVPLIVASLVVYFVRQTAELNRMNEQLQEANRKLQAIDAMKTGFISTASHELRTPLTTVKAFIELLQMKPDMPAQRREQLVATINTEVDRLSRLVSDLLDLARIEAGDMNWRRDEVSIEDVVRESVAGMGPFFEKKGLVLNTVVPEPLRRVVGDRDRLVQVVMNILSNAVKFTPEGGTIRIAAHQRPGPPAQVVVEISDTGLGIPAADRELIFERFHRSSDPRTRAIEGTGLGLAIAKQIVVYHGGSIRADSVGGNGSTLTVTLPTV